MILHALLFIGHFSVITVSDGLFEMTFLPSEEKTDLFKFSKLFILKSWRR